MIGWGRTCILDFSTDGGGPGAGKCCLDIGFRHIFPKPDPASSVSCFWMLQNTCPIPQGACLTIPLNKSLLQWWLSIPYWEVTTNVVKIQKIQCRWRAAQLWLVKCHRICNQWRWAEFWDMMFRNSATWSLNLVSQRWLLSFRKLSKNYIYAG